MAPPAKSNLPTGLIKRILIILAVIVAFAIAITSCVARVDAAHVGIRVKLAGTNRGVDDIPVVTGWVFYNPFTEQLVMFPTSVQNVVWSREVAEGARNVDESITFSSGEGVNINADIGLSFHILPNKAPHLYLKFREPNLLKLADGYVRNAVREAFNLGASKLPVQEIYGAGKSKLLNDVEKVLQEKFAEDGIVIDQLTFNGALRLPENVASAINRAMEATQTAIQAENKVRQVKAEAEQEVTQAEGHAAASRARAQGEADSRLITARAEAKANLILRLSTTTSVLQYRALEKWNGKLPVMNQGALPLLTFDASKIADLTSEDDKKLAALLGDTEDSNATEPKKDEKKEEKPVGPPANPTPTPTPRPKP